MKNKVGLVVDDRYLNHQITQSSPENPLRIKKLSRVVRDKFSADCFSYPGRLASAADIEAVHSSFYLQQLRDHVLRADPYSYDRDTYLMEHSLYTAELASGGCLELADKLVAGEIDSGFALIRPPGHHAEPGRGMGFCILNNVAVTAQYLRRKYQLNRILILDFDAHHGNGTQEIFYDTEEVLVVSIHQKDIFPFTGTSSEIGEGKGEGYNINIPVYSQFGDGEYTYLIGRLLQSVVEQFLPQIVLVSAGYDGHKDETISGTLLSTRWYGAITTMLKQYAEEVCDVGLLMVLEGGYNPASLELSVVETIQSLVQVRNGKTGVLFSPRGHQVLENHELRRFWTI